jgi:hypothetical protein
MSMAAATASQELTKQGTQIVVSHMHLRPQDSCAGALLVSARVHLHVDYGTLLQPAGIETDVHGLQRLPLRKEGWNFWQWKGNRVHYITAGKYNLLV